MSLGYRVPSLKTSGCANAPETGTDGRRSSDSSVLAASHRSDYFSHTALRTRTLGQRAKQARRGGAALFGEERGS